MYSNGARAFRHTCYAMLIDLRERRIMSSMKFIGGMPDGFTGNMPDGTIGSGTDMYGDMPDVAGSSWLKEIPHD